LRDEQINVPLKPNGSYMNTHLNMIFFFLKKKKETYLLIIKVNLSCFSPVNVHVEILKMSQEKDMWTTTWRWIFLQLD